MIARIATATLVLAAGMSAAAAHAMLEHASPPVGSMVQQAPARLTLTFSEPLEAAFSSATVVNAAGKRVDSGARASGTTLQISLRPLPSGTYRVNWRVLSVDTHRTEGSYSFTVSGR
jgi:methionine-rich copper-binding protein CopC